jgi:hypothetical protein
VIENTLGVLHNTSNIIIEGAPHENKMAGKEDGGRGMKRKRKRRRMGKRDEEE